MLVVRVSRLFDSRKQSDISQAWYQTVIKLKPGAALSANTPIILRENRTHKTMRQERYNRENGKKDGERFHVRMWPNSFIYAAAAQIEIASISLLKAMS